MEASVAHDRAKAEAAYERARKALIALAPDEWAQYVLARSAYEKARRSYAMAKDSLEAYEKAYAALKAAAEKAELAYEKAWEELNAAAPDQMAAYVEAKRRIIVHLKTALTLREGRADER